MERHKAYHREDRAKARPRPDQTATQRHTRQRQTWTGQNREGKAFPRAGQPARHKANGSERQTERTKTRAKHKQNTQTSEKKAARQTAARQQTGTTWAGLDWTGRTGTTILYGRLVHVSPEASRLTTRLTDGHRQQNNPVRRTRNVNVKKVTPKHKQNRGFFDRNATNQTEMLFISQN